VVAELVRLDGDDRAGGLCGRRLAAIRQRRDDLGLSTAGRRQEGWEIVSGVAF
jgi:hypothetical protein